jgi:hypothetical protein
MLIPLPTGTLTVPVIDFQYMRQRVGVGPTGDILDIISSWPPEEQQRAHQAIQEIEEQALRDMQVRGRRMPTRFGRTTPA